MSYSHPQQGKEAERLRKEAGAYLKKLREAEEITQKDLAATIGFEYYTMVSAVESGRTRIPPDRMRAWAVALKREPAEFGKRMLQYYDPHMWSMLFGEQKV
ncbi:MAG: helix-turn-helix transcriptional regulator [Candidatus Kaistia colombiensis]|nr:MAG: helix-turn-helix transcriptional regulator [Kaistia sp.]